MHRVAIYFIPCRKDRSMEVDPMEIIQQPDEPTGQAAQDRAISRLNTLVAITVAILATFMGICKEKEELKAQADQDQKDYDAANFRDDQFDLSDALLAIAISLLAVTALTHKRWLYAVAMVPTAFGILMGLSGLLGWSIHPTRLIQ